MYLALRKCKMTVKYLKDLKLLDFLSDFILTLCIVPQFDAQKHFAHVVLLSKQQDYKSLIILIDTYWFCPAGFIGNVCCYRNLVKVTQNFILNVL